MQTILVTGGAGYIGSCAVKMLVEKGFNVIVVDNLSKGKRSLVDKKAKFYKIDLVDKKKLKKVFSENKIDAVMHFAAYKSVEESMVNAIKYSDNITGLINLLDCMVESKVNKIVYSSSAAVYGMPSESIVTEDSQTIPINYYGYTKLFGEGILKWYNQSYGITYVALRYFNVAGDSGLLYVDPDAKNIFPILMEVIKGKREKLTIFGNDYPTKDGTCIRDYIDVNDLCEAHILALNLKSSEIINLGTGKGLSVDELRSLTEKISSKKSHLSMQAEEVGIRQSLLHQTKKQKNCSAGNQNTQLKT